MSVMKVIPEMKDEGGHRDFCECEECCGLDPLPALPPCGLPDCDGCSTCNGYDRYVERMQKALQQCKRERFYSDPLAAGSGIDIESISCSCQICTMELFDPQNDEDQE